MHMWDGGRCYTTRGVVLKPSIDEKPINKVNSLQLTVFAYLFLLVKAFLVLASQFLVWLKYKDEYLVSHEPSADFNLFLFVAQVLPLFVQHFADLTYLKVRREDRSRKKDKLTKALLWILFF